MSRGYDPFYPFRSLPLPSLLLTQRHRSIEVALGISPLLAAAWFTPLAVGGMFLAVCGGLLLHVLPNRVLMIVSQAGFLVSVLLFAVIPERGESGSGPSISKIYWAYVFPAMLCGTIGIDITFNITNVFITTAMPSRLQSTAGGVINSLLYLGMAFWLGVGELAVSSTILTRGEEAVPLREQYRIGFWTGVGLAAVAMVLVSTIRLGKAKAAMTADEKAEMDAAAAAAASTGDDGTAAEEEAKRAGGDGARGQ